MTINGWSYDFPSLPQWNLRDEIPYVSDALYENAQQDIAFLMYSIVEYRMGCYAGHLVVLRNKKKPEAFLQVEKAAFSNSEVVFSMDGKLAFVKSAIWDGGWPVFVFDLSTQRFACVKTTTNNISFTVKEIEQNDFALVADAWQMQHDASGLLKKLHGTRIETAALTWLPFSEMDAFVQNTLA